MIYQHYLLPNLENQPHFDNHNHDPHTILLVTMTKGPQFIHTRKSKIYGNFSEIVINHSIIDNNLPKNVDIQ